ncbi:MAG: hypothetical protein HDT28_03875 [Clostridiales bacterium]|nr:hypothetical protein [Clostridiales bacterium]
MEIFYEQNVVNNNIDERTKKTKSLTITKTICLIFGLSILLMGATAISFFWAFLIGSLPFFAATLVVSRINKRNNTEYDYVLDDEYLSISEIYFRERRKLKHKIRLRLVENVGVFDSEGYKKIEKSATKKILALVNYEDEKSIIYILYNTDKGKRILFIEPDRGFMLTLRRILPALTVFDKSISDFEKRLTELEMQNHADSVKSTDEDADDGEDEQDSEYYTESADEAIDKTYKDGDE